MNNSQILIKEFNPDTRTILAEYTLLYAGEEKKVERLITLPLSLSNKDEIIKALKGDFLHLQKDNEETQSFNKNLEVINEIKSLENSIISIDENIDGNIEDNNFDPIDINNADLTSPFGTLSQIESTKQIILETLTELGLIK